MLRRPIPSAFLLWYLAACTTWHVEKGASPQQVISTEQPDVVRLTRANGGYLILRQPRVAVGDSLAGVHNGVPSSVAVSDVAQVAVRKVSAGKTIGLALGIVAVIGIGAAIGYGVYCSQHIDCAGN